MVRLKEVTLTTDISEHRLVPGAYMDTAARVVSRPESGHVPPLLPTLRRPQSRARGKTDVLARTAKPHDLTSCHRTSSLLAHLLQINFRRRLLLVLKPGSGPCLLCPVPGTFSSRYKYAWLVPPFLKVSQLICYNVTSSGSLP